MSYRIQPFEERWQTAAADLINNNLMQRFGFPAPEMNPDLFDIANSYTDGTFLIAVEGEQLIGTGALTPERADRGRIERMHTHPACRRQGLGSAMLDALTAEARRRRYRCLVLETNTDWTDAIRFYRDRGFSPTHESGGETHFERWLTSG